MTLTPAEEDILNTLIDMSGNGSLDRACFSDVPISVYHHPNCPGVSSTFLKHVAEKSYAYARFEQAGPGMNSQAIELGRAFHAMMEGEKYTGTQKTLEALKVMEKRVRAHPEVETILTGALFEQTYFARCEWTGVLRKARPDIINGAILADWKTCRDASRPGFAKAARGYQYRISARYYMDVVGAVRGEAIEDFRFIAVETERLFDVAVYSIHPKSLELAAEEIQLGLSLIEKAEKGEWTGYPIHASPIFI